VNSATFASQLILAIAALTMAATPSGAVVTINPPNACADKDALQNIAIDAQMNAIKLYYRGLIQGMGDPRKQVCLQTHVLLDDQFAVINKTRDLVVSQCLPIDVAAEMALKGLCP
jgi:hypothetical protein